MYLFLTSLGVCCNRTRLYNVRKRDVQSDSVSDNLRSHIHFPKNCNPSIGNQEWSRASERGWPGGPVPSKTENFRALGGHFQKVGGHCFLSWKWKSWVVRFLFDSRYDQRQSVDQRLSVLFLGSSPQFPMARLNHQWLSNFISTV